jgi:hypothetical protein
MACGPQVVPAGILIVWTDVPIAIEADFNDWYNREHLPDRILRMPGFLRGRRFVARSGTPKFLTLYDLQNTAVMLSAAHTALRKQRTARDRKFVPQFRNTIKGICDVVCRAGSGEGDGLVLLPVIADAEQGPRFKNSLCGHLLPELAAASAIASAVYAVRNATITQASSAKDDRAGDRYVEGVFAIETTGEAGVTTALAALSAENLGLMGGRPHLIAAPGVLHLTYQLAKPAAVD